MSSAAPSTCSSASAADRRCPASASEASRVPSANAAARRLADGLAAIPGVTLSAPTEANLVFAEMPEAISAGLAADGFSFAAWRGGNMTRLVASFATTEADVDALLAAARTALP